MEYLKNLFTSDLGPLFTFLACVVVVIVIAGILAYILGSIGMMKIAEKSGIKHGWLAWIPVASTYLLGKVAFPVSSQVIAFFVVSLLSSSGGVFIRLFGSGIGNVGGIQALVNIVSLITWYIACYKVYSKLSAKAVLMLVFTIVTFGAMAPIFFFAIRKNEIIKKV